jgi:hypothetical protein
VSREPEDAAAFYGTLSFDPATELQRLPGPFDQPFGSEQPELTERDHVLRDGI